MPLRKGSGAIKGDIVGTWSSSQLSFEVNKCRNSNNNENYDIVEVVSKAQLHRLNGVGAPIPLARLTLSMLVLLRQWTTSFCSIACSSKDVIVLPLATAVVATFRTSYPPATRERLCKTSGGYHTCFGDDIEQPQESKRIVFYRLG